MKSQTVSILWPTNFELYFCYLVIFFFSQREPIIINRYITTCGIQMFELIRKVYRIALKVLIWVGGGGFVFSITEHPYCLTDDKIHNHGHPLA